MNNDIIDLLTEEALDLIDRATSKRHLNIQRIESLRDYSETKLERKKIYLYAKCFRKTSKILLNEYVKTLEFDKRDLSLLADANALDSYADFFFEEVNMYDNVLNEYTNYLKQGHVIDAFLGKERED